MPFLDNSRYIWRVWLSCAKASVIREMEFRANFILGFLRQFLWLAAFLTTIEVAFQNTSSLAGWSKSDALIILALSRLIEGSVDLFFSRNIVELPRLVQKGDFDLLLLKPGPIQFHTAFRRIHIYYLGNIMAGVALMIYALSIRESLPPFSDWALFSLTLVIGILVFYSLLLLISSLVFFLERLEALYGFFSLFTEPLTVPFDIFPRVPRAIITYFLPLAFIVFVPAQALTGRVTWQRLLYGVAIAVVFFVFANLSWRAGLRRYTSAS